MTVDLPIKARSFCNGSTKGKLSLAHLKHMQFEQYGKRKAIIQDEWTALCSRKNVKNELIYLQNRLKTNLWKS